MTVLICLDDIQEWGYAMALHMRALDADCAVSVSGGGE
ncbi:hypothetical protein AM1_B0373 (plasmid) [Acaryochloris marina MBIC11017]|uniref:Uncharacterized protein n=1 Tax=Acaryochloris marina (strain MBIC 11017) TaxID=329726 RepID=A8ZLR4_ACAM1|nr:hypothetical protein AM1_B0373 [Acaryochloris marina MBIC11017]